MITVNAYTCFFVVRNGKVTGGKFDWLTVNQASKTLENIEGGYLSGISPISKEACWFALLSLDGSQITNFVETTWP